jgi:GxxExxY protein
VAFHLRHVSDKGTTTEDTQVRDDEGDEHGHATVTKHGPDTAPAGQADKKPGLVHARTTTAILTAAYRVHGTLGPGLLERVYHTCVCHELTRMGIPFQREKPLPVHYDGLVLDIGYRVDLLVDGKVIVEVKAVDQIHPVHEAQLLSYLRLSRVRVGLLINFNVKDLRQGIRRKILG